MNWCAGSKRSKAEEAPGASKGDEADFLHCLVAAAACPGGLFLSLNGSDKAMQKIWYSRMLIDSSVTKRRPVLRFLEYAAAVCKKPASNT